MGLDLVLSRIDRDPDFHARWSYSGFMAFRRRLASEIGIDLAAMAGFGGETPWPSAADEPLVHLLHHSDCDGELGYDECRGLGTRIRGVVAPWPEDDYDRLMAEKLARMCDHVADGDAETVVFT